MSMTHPPTLRKSGEGRTIAVVGDVYRLLATGDDDLLTVRGAFHQSRQVRLGLMYIHNFHSALARLSLASLDAICKKPKRF